MAEEAKKKGQFSGIVGLKCPQCRQGDLFKKPGLYVISGMGDMYDRCPVCNLKYEQEPGFWWGSMYLNYGTSVAIVLPAFIIFYSLFKLEFYTALSLAGFLLFLLVPMVFRLGRSCWIYWFGKYRSV